MRRLIVLRPEPGASRTVARAQALGLNAVAMPLFAIEPVAWDVPDPADFDALLLTSANAVRHGGEGLQRLRSLPAHAVGEATAEAARTAGFSVASTGTSGVDALLADTARDTRLLHLAGEDRHAPSDDRRGITAVTVYRAVPILDRLDIASCVAAVHSPRAGRRLAELVADRSTIAVAAISPAAAGAVGRGWQAVESADAPSDTALLALAARLCNNRSER
jgi:uroporphyrinogen-III synthase